MFFNKKNKVALVKLTELDPKENINEFDLVEIEDEDVIDRIICSIPEAAKVIANGAVAVKAGALSDFAVFQAILPSGAKLVKSRDMQGAFRGFFRENGKIAGHANLIPADGTMEKIKTVNLTNAAMGAAALVVGQYYMKRIDSKLSEISENVSRLERFYKNDYKSRVMTLIFQLRGISDYKTEILEDDLLREEAIRRLQAMETTCMDLLNFANIEIDQVSCGKCKNFEEYSKDTAHIREWQVFQINLLNTLFAIADLNYTFHFGAMSREYCYRYYDDCFNYTKKVIDKMKQWHRDHNESLGIELDKAVYEKSGIEKLLAYPFAWINNDIKYKRMEKGESDIIREQKYTQIFNLQEQCNNLYLEDARIIFKYGKIFYLPTKK